MPPSELPPRVLTLARELFAEARAVLSIAAPLRCHGRTVTYVHAPDDRLPTGTPFDAALVRIEGDALQLLGRLRPLLADGAPLLLVSRGQASTLSRLRAFAGGERARDPRLTELCDAVLRRGLCAPRAHETGGGFVAVSACMPAARDALDDFFEQPTLSAHR